MEMLESFNMYMSLSFYNFLLLCSAEAFPTPPIKSQTTLAEPQPQTDSPIRLDLSVEDLLAAGYHNDRTPWTEKEDLLLTKLAKRNDLTWNQIAEQIPNRTPKMCYSRFRRLSNQTKARWTSKEDNTIRMMVEDLGEEWSRISQALPGRTAKQIEQHYNYCLRPEISKRDWTLEEDLHLIGLLGTYGKNWNVLEGNMNGRTQHQIKNRYFGRLKKLQQRKEAKMETYQSAMHQKEE